MATMTKAGRGQAKKANKKPAKPRGAAAIQTIEDPAVDRDADSARNPEPIELGPQQIDLRCLTPNPWQPRQAFDEPSIIELAASIQTHGLLQRLLVRPHPELAGTYQIADGARRFLALKQAGKVIALVDVRDLSDQQMAEMAIIANDQRTDLSDIDRAKSFVRIMKEFEHSETDLAIQLKRSVSYVRNLLRLLQLPDKWQSRVGQDGFSASHAEIALPILKKDADDPLRKRLEKFIDRRDGHIPPVKLFKEEVDHLKESVEPPAKPSKVVAKSSKEDRAAADLEKGIEERQREIAEWRTDWLRYLIWKLIADDQDLSNRIGVLLVLVNACADQWMGAGGDIFNEQLSLLKLKDDSCAGIYHFLAGMDSPETAAGIVAPALFWDSKTDKPPMCSHNILQPDLIEAVAADLLIYLKAEWKDKSIADSLVERWVQINWDGKGEVLPLPKTLPAEIATLKKPRGKKGAK